MNLSREMSLNPWKEAQLPKKKKDRYAPIPIIKSLRDLLPNNDTYRTHTDYQHYLSLMNMVSLLLLDKISCRVTLCSRAIHLEKR